MEERKNNTKKYTGKKNTHEKMRRIKALIAAGILTITAGSALYITGFENGYKEAEQSYIEVVDKSEDEIADMIENKIKEEYAQAVSVDVEDVKIDVEHNGSSYVTTKIGDNENSFEFNQDLRGSGNSGNLKATKYRGLITEYKNAVNTGASKEELVKLLKKVNEKTEKYDLKVNEKGNLVENEVEER